MPSWEFRRAHRFALACRIKMEAMVEPPDGASYVVAAYKGGEVEPHKLAWSIPRHVLPGGHVTDAQRYLYEEVVHVASSPAPTDSHLLGVVYADSPLAAKEATLSAVSVAVTGIVTIIDKLFSLDKKKDATAGKFIYAAAEGGLTYTVTDHRVGMLLEAGSQNDGRVLLRL